MSDQIDSIKIIKYLKSKWGDEKRCPMCDQTEWIVNDKIFELREFKGGSIILGNIPIFPVIPIICKNCSNTIFINPINARLLDVKKESNQEKDGK